MKYSINKLNIEQNLRRVNNKDKWMTLIIEVSLELTLNKYGILS